MINVNAIFTRIHSYTKRTVESTGTVNHRNKVALHEEGATIKYHLRAYLIQKTPQAEYVVWFSVPNAGAVEVHLQLKTPPFVFILT